MLNEEQAIKKITVYSLSTCPVCKRVKKFLDEKGIPYTLIEVDTLEGSEQWVMTRNLARYNPNGTYPTTVIEDAVIGYDPESLTEKLSDVDTREA